MASRPAALDRYKLASVFNEDSDTVVHTTYESDLPASRRRVVVRATWKRQKKLGAGAIGVVWCEKDERTGSVRAVKVVSKLHINVRELKALVQVQDVRPIPIDSCSCARD